MPIEFDHQSMPCAPPHFLREKRESTSWRTLMPSNPGDEGRDVLGAIRFIADPASS